MKFQCKKNDIKNKITLIERITGKNQSLLVLSAILFEAKENTLTLKATNLEVGVEVVVRAKIIKTGSMALLGRVINTYLNSINGEDDTITFEVVENNISISTKKNSTLIKTIQTNDFPNIPHIEDKNNTHTINAKVFTEGLRAVLFAVSTSDIKPEISSVYVYSEDTTLVFVATDSFRLAEKKITTKNKLSISPLLIPFRNTYEFIRFFDGIHGDLAVFFDKNQLAVFGDGMYVTTRLTDGVYPPYKQIIPAKFKTNITVQKKDLIDALKTANIFLDEFNRIIVKAHTNDGIVEIESKNNDLGENVSRVEAHVDGDDVEMKFNHKYFSEALPGILGDSVSLRFNEQHKPMVISGVGDPSFIYLVMPVTR